MFEPLKFYCIKGSTRHLDAIMQLIKTPRYICWLYVAIRVDSYGPSYINVYIIKIDTLSLEKSYLCIITFCIIRPDFVANFCNDSPI